MQIPRWGGGDAPPSSKFLQNNDLKWPNNLPLAAKQTANDIT